MVISMILFKISLLLLLQVSSKKNNHGQECRLDQTSTKLSWVMRAILELSQIVLLELDQFLRYKSMALSFFHLLKLAVNSWRKCQSNLCIHPHCVFLTMFNSNLVKQLSLLRRVDQSKSSMRSRNSSF